MAAIDEKQWVEASCEDVWAVCTEFEGWSFWAGVGAVEIETPGEGGPNTVGTVATVQAPGLTLRFRVTALERPNLLCYTLLSRGPFRGHTGRIVFEARPHGTVVRWHVDFSPRVPGTRRAVAFATGLALRFVLERLENRLAPLEKHRSHCPYSDAPDGKGPTLRLRGRAALRRALLQAKMN